MKNLGATVIAPALLFSGCSSAFPLALPNGEVLRLTDRTGAATISCDLQPGSAPYIQLQQFLGAHPSEWMRSSASYVGVLEIRGSDLYIYVLGKLDTIVVQSGGDQRTHELSPGALSLLGCQHGT